MIGQYIYCADYWPTIGAPIIVPPILARSATASFNPANPTWDVNVCSAFVTLLLLQRRHECHEFG